MQTKSKQISDYQLGRLRVPDHLSGIRAAIFLLSGFPFVVQSQESAEMSADKVSDFRYVLFDCGGNVLLQPTDAE